MLYIFSYILKVIVIAIVTLIVKKTIKDPLVQNIVAIAGLFVLFHQFNYGILSCLSYIISFYGFNLALNYNQKSKRDQLFFYGLCFFASTVIDFDIFFILLGTVKFAVFSLHEILVILMFLLHTLPKLLTLYGNLNQIDFIYKEEMQNAAKNNKNKNGLFFFFLLAKIIGDVFFTDRSQLLRDREIACLRADVSEALDILKAQNGITTKGHSKLQEKNKLE